MRFGTAKDIITPIAPMKLACPGGDFNLNFTAIHDDVYVRCLVLDDGREKTVLMSFDLLFHDRSLNLALEAYAKEKYGIKPGSVVISYTHAHTSPASRGYNPGAHDEEYERLLLSRAKACLDRAICAMFEGTMEYGSFDADYNVSRRGIVNGEFTNAPNFDYDHDTKFNVMCVRDSDGNVRSLVMNYACHPVFYPAKMTVSGEFPARLCQYIDMKYYGCTSLFFQSAGGDVRPRPTIKENQETGSFCWNVNLGFEGIDAFVKNISADVSAFVDNGSCKKAELSIASDEFDIELEMNPASIETFKEKYEAHKNDLPNPNKRNVEYIMNGGYNELPETLSLHCQTVRLNDSFYLATVGGEPCYGVEKAIVSAFGDKDVFFIGYTDSCAYIVDDVVLAEGGYEPTCHLEYCLKGPFKSGLNKLYADNFKASVARISK